MKKTIISLLAFLAASMGASAQTISVAGDVEALASGETVSFNLHITDAVAMTSMHFEIVLPSAFTVSAVTPTQAWMATFSHESGVVGAMSPTTSAFSGEGDIATIQLTVPANTATGSYPVIVNNVRVNGTNLETTATFNVKVVERHTVLLDELSATAPTSANGVDVRVRRTIKAGEWSTICLPFAMTAEQVTAAFGNDVHLGDFTGCTVDDETENITVNFTEVTAIAANHPYIIKVKSLVEEFTVDGVDITPEEEPVIDKDEVTTGSGRNKKTTYNSFIGNYVYGTLVPDYGLFLASNQFWFSKGETVIKAFRGYFDLASAGAEYEESEAARIAIAFEDQTTGVTTLSKIPVATGTYSLSGQRVQKPGKGIYVRDGKKMVIK